ncbi:polysaccharide deacetylase [Natranaerovirga pectinivora]|uniref:Polysaccharide deacetylase n=1 Tax=Natranaerovirga pectinivora TaxID=682400 RepID=A0A4R3MJ88_9FIRM|nr:polysaccharide deacetylase family protein [Natranaerovirga pectinivora]TCT14334.1 polysaccharide deacetylase [Natranaerovirga pectinivora]
MKKFKFIIAIGILSILLSGCSQNITDNEKTIDNNTYDNTQENSTNIDEKEKNGSEENLDNDNIEDEPNEIEEGPPVIDYQEVRPNELGHIMVVMYHGIRDLPPYHRTAEDFIKDLQYMYDNGYRLISMRDYIDHNIDIGPGLTPIVLTFDDGLSTTFSLTKENSALVPAPNTAVALLEAFAEENPDFGKAAVFYINSDLSIFDGEGTVEERLQWLVDNGYEVANHTSQHADLSKLDGNSVQVHIGKADQFIKNILGNDYIVDSLTYPFGRRPATEYLQYVSSGVYNGHKYEYKVAFREGPSGPFHPPIHINFAPLNVPRVRGSEGDIQDLLWFFDYYESNPHLRYISDGNKDRISILESQSHLINKDAIGDKELYIYTIEE